MFGGWIFKRTLLLPIRKKLVKPIVLKASVTKGYCSNRYCNNKCSGSMCSTCRCRKSRLDDPVRYAYNNLKNRAQQRGKEFTITLDEFRKFCVRVKYIGRRGRSAESFTIDRAREEDGYHIDNIQVMKLKDNIKKYFNYCWQTKRAYVY
jgi:hypothetical protein